MNKVGVFIDLSNLYYTTRDRYKGGKPDYRAMYKYCASFGTITTAVAYGAQIGKQAQSFICALQHIGFSTKYREPKELTGPKGTYLKADWDVGMTVDIIDAVQTLGLDFIILGTGDGDFAPLVEWCTKQDIKVLVLGCNISFELKEKTQHCVEIPQSMVEQRRRTKK